LIHFYKRAKEKLRMRSYKLMAVFLFLATLTITVQAGSRFRRDASEDANKALGQAQDDINDFFAKIYGGKCAKANAITGNQCLSPVSDCDTSQGSGLGVDGECRPVWWAWLAIGLVVLMLLGGFLCCCICCCCSAILDCLCCCCRGN
jgi:hypothetical protein